MSDKEELTTSEEATFDVSKEELSVIRSDLASDFPDDYTYLSDDYITSVASKPYSKDPTVRRPLEYTTEKLKDLLTWREENAIGLKELLSMVQGSGNDPAVVESLRNMRRQRRLQPL